VSVLEQILLLQALTRGQLDTIGLENLDAAERALRLAAAQLPLDAQRRLRGKSPPTTSDIEILTRAATEALVGVKS
jgi:F-type H+/Na+-transporting ATPase subunit alpha